MNPLKSRSTIIGLAAIAAFVAFGWMVLTSGYFDAGFAAAGLLFLGKVIDAVFNHQAKLDVSAAPVVEPSKPMSPAK